MLENLMELTKLVLVSSLKWLMEWLMDYPFVPAFILGLAGLFFQIGFAIRRHFFTKCACCGKSADHSVKTPEGKQHYCDGCFENRRGYFEWLEENQEGFSYSELGVNDEDEKDDEEEEDEEEEDDREEDEK